jgi:hypothetical protein
MPGQTDAMFVDLRKHLTNVAGSASADGRGSEAHCTGKFDADDGHVSR